MSRIATTTAFPSGADWSAGTARAWHAAQSVQSVESVTELRSSDMELTEAVMVRATGAIYVRDAASVADDDGESVIHDMLGRRYVLREMVSGAVADAVAEAAGIGADADRAEAARDAALLSTGLYASTAQGIGLGVRSIAITAAGSGGTNGTWPWATTGGTAVIGATGTVTIAGGAVVAVAVNQHGLYTVAPTAIAITGAGALTGFTYAMTNAVNTAVNGYFSVPVAGSDTAADLYRVDAGPVATLVTSYASTAAILPNLGSYVTGLTAAASGSISSDTVYRYWPDSLKTYDQICTLFAVGRNAAGFGYIDVAFVEGDGSLSARDDLAIPLPSGVSSNAVEILVPAGCVIGYGGVQGVYFQSGAGPTMWTTASKPTASTAKTITTVNAMKHTFTLTARAKHAGDRVLELVEAVGGTQALGWPDPIVGTGSTAPAYTVIDRRPAKGAGRIRQVTVGMASAGSLRVSVVTLAGAVRTKISEAFFTVAAGVNVIACDIEIAEGQFWEVAATGIKFQNNANPLGIGQYYSATIAADGATMTAGSAHRFEMQALIDYGLQAMTASSAANDDGTGLLDAADASGIADATADFSSARASTPAPYVRPGSFALTALAYGGDGLHGEGTLKIGGQPFFIPKTRKAHDLFTACRMALNADADAANVLTFIGDSKTHWAYAPTADQHFGNMLTRFLNMGIAIDEPIMTAFADVSTYTPAFYGVTRGGSYTFGTRGPLAQSIILASGASLSFVGAYETVDVFYRQEAGAGSLAFAYNGAAAYKTVSAAGATQDDKWSGPSATGQAASGTYTITATGGAVEITALVREGVKVAGSPPRLRTMRAARGSYGAASFNATTIASIKAIAAAWGGKMLPIIGLGTNDMISTTPATITSNFAQMLAAINSGTAPDKIMAWLPQKPDAAWIAASLTGGKTYESAVAAMQREYRTNGVKIIPIASRNHAETGLFAAGDCHENAGGNLSNAQIIAEWLAEKFED